MYEALSTCHDLLQFSQCCCRPLGSFPDQISPHLPMLTIIKSVDTYATRSLYIFIFSPKMILSLFSLSYLYVAILQSSQVKFIYITHFVKGVNSVLYNK